MLKSGFEPIRLKSKRNVVLRLGDVVEKHYEREEAAAFEARQLMRLRDAGVRVPEVIRVEGAVLFMRYIPGETLPDFLERMEEAPDEEAIQTAAWAVAGWLRSFYLAVEHERTGEIHGDANGRNFILSGGVCWGVDFEERMVGEVARDVGRILVFLISYDPPDTPVKRAFAEWFKAAAVGELGVGVEEIERYRELEIEAMKLRRG